MSRSLYPYLIGVLSSSFPEIHMWPGPYDFSKTMDDLNGECCWDVDPVFPFTLINLAVTGGRIDGIHSAHIYRSPGHGLSGTA